MSGPDYYKSMIDSYEKKLRAKDKQIKKLDEHNEWLIDKVNELADKVKGLEEQADDMAEKHADKNIVIHNFKTALEWIKECSVDYQSINKAANALYEVSNHGK